MENNISIIIPVYGVENYIEECLRSVMAQDGIDRLKIECLIVDDCGTDRSMEIAKKVINAYSGQINFRIITREENGGLSAARNSGIREARGEYLYFLDSDDFIAPHCLSTLWKKVVEHPNVEIVYGKTVCYPDSNMLKPYFNLQSKGIPEYAVNSTEVRKKHLDIPEVAWNKLVRRDWLIVHGLFFTEGIIHEDTDWHLRAYFHTNTYSCSIDTTPTYLYRQRNGSIMTKDNLSSRLQKKNHIYIQTAQVAPFWDKYFFGFMAAHMLSLKFNAYGIDRSLSNSLFSSFCLSISNISSLPLKYRYLVKYIMLSRPWLRVQIINTLIKVL